MSALRMSYVCTDPGIPVDGTKGASVHFREMGRALVDVGFDVQALVRRRARNVGGLPFRFSVVPRRRRSQDGLPTLVDELEEIARQDAVMDALEDFSRPDLVYERYSLFGLAGLYHARRHGVPFVLEVNAPLWEEAARFRRLGLRDLARQVARELVREADLVLAVSPRLRERLILEGAAPDRVRVFPNGVAPCFFEPGAPFRRPAALADKPILVFVGSLKPWHGIELLLAALEEGALEQTGLWIVGDGPLRDVVAAAAARHPDHLVFEGPVPHERIASILRAADVAVAPYPAHAPDYFCPLKVFEALCAGARLVTSRVPAVEDLVPAGAPIHWFEPDSVEGLARAVREALAAGPAGLPCVCTARDHGWQARAEEILAFARYSGPEALTC